MQIRTCTVNGARWLAFVCVLSLLNASCTLKLVADYDEGIDRAATSLQQEMDAHLTRLEGLGGAPSAAFADHAQFYADYGVKLRSVRIRAQGHERNEITIQQVERMENSLAELRDQHQRSGALPAAFIDSARQLFNTGWAAVIRWEIAKKRGRQ